MRSLTAEEVRILAEQERRMDAGEQPYVMLQGNRVAVSPGTMKELGLVSGQTISDQIFQSILVHQLATLQAEIALSEARERVKKAGAQ